MQAVPRIEDPEFFISRSFDLSTPVQVRRTVESIFQATADNAFPPFLALPYLYWLGALIGLAYGWGGAGRLYGPFGAVIGAAAGYSLARAAGFLLARTLLARWSLPHAIARAAESGRYAAALNQAERLGSLKIETDPARIARWRGFASLIALRDILLGQRYRAPAAVLAANLLGTQGLLHETLNQPEAALICYQRALGFFPDHPYLVYVALGLLEKHPDLEWDRSCLQESLRRVQRQRHGYARFIFILYHDLIARLFPGLESLPRPATGAGPEPAGAVPGPRSMAAAAAGRAGCFIRLSESLADPVPSGLLVVEGETVSVVRLAGATYQLAQVLAKRMREEAHLRHPAERQGWVSAPELIETLPKLAPGSTPETIKNLFHKLRRQLQEAGVTQELFEESERGSYRMAVEAGQIMLDPASSAKI